MMNYALSKTATMVKPTPITIPIEPIGRIPRPVDLIERVKKGDSEDRKLAPLYDVAVRDTIECFEGAGSPVVTDGERESITISARIACIDFRTRHRLAS